MKRRSLLAFGNARNSSILSGPFSSCLASYVSCSRYNGEGRSTSGVMVRSTIFGVPLDHGSIWLMSYRKDHCALCRLWSARYCLCWRTIMERRERNSATQNSQETEHSLWRMVHLLLGRLIFPPYVKFRVPTLHFTFHIRHTTQACSLKQEPFWLRASLVTPHTCLTSRVLTTAKNTDSNRVVIYYIPIWFQAIKGVSAVESGIRNIPLILGLVIVSMISGIFITVLGYYTPFMILSSVLMATGAGLISTFKVGTGHAMWIGFQAIYGFGVGAGMQQGIIAAQTVCTLDDVPTATGTFSRLDVPSQIGNTDRGI